MRTLILPDIHHRVHIARAIIDLEKADQIVHLGDHQDNFGDSPANAVVTAAWTKERLEAGDIVLLGNHDLPYWFYHEKHNWGCGWTPEKHRVIQAIIPDELRRKFRLWAEVDGWILSHAGFTSMYADLIPSQDIFLEETLWQGKTHPLIYHVGSRRGGMGPGGGILWLDWDDFKMNEDASNVAWKQIVGHTPHKYPQDKKRLDGNTDWNLDTNLKHYGILEDGKLTIKESPSNEK